MKREVDSLDATPSKRLYLSIIADYDILKALSELVDNALDAWVRAGRARNIHISVEIDTEHQYIVVQDDAGGLPKEELKFVVGPGQTSNSLADETIGIFGVGTKRAVVALSRDIKIRTRFGKRKSYEVDIDEAWIQNEEWDLPVYEVDQVAESSTVVELQKLRQKVTEVTVEQVREHLSATYAKFLATGAVSISVNSKPVRPRFFENWAYPPSYSPRRYKGLLPTADGSVVRVEVLAGLSRESSPAAGEYGVYVYCNDRLVARGLRSWEVGFSKGLAGLPHPKVSLTRVLVFLNGPAHLMPWNSSKSDINSKHEVFVAMRDWLIQVVKDYATVSRGWMGQWPERVFKYESGAVVDVEIESFPLAKKSHLPPMPKVRPRFNDIVTARNRLVANNKPWCKGLYEGVIAAELISKQRLEQKNRISFVVLDSTLEIAFKEFLVNESGQTYNDAKLLQIFANRGLVHAEVKKYLPLTTTLWKQVNHYYQLRNKLVHERASAGIADTQLADFRELVEKLLRRMFKLKFS